MTAVTEATRQRACQLFSQEQYPQVVELLDRECGNNLPFLQNESAEGLERFRFAALKLSEGNLEKLRSAIELAKKDWRDLLVAAGFAHSVDAHKSWSPR
jgi:hypothetical protein